MWDMHKDYERISPVVPCISGGHLWSHLGMPAPRERTGVSDAVAAQIRAERAAVQLTLEQVAKGSGIPFSTYRKLDDGRGVPDSSQLARLCQVWGIPLSEFFRRVEARLATQNAGTGTGSRQQSG